MVDSSPVMSPVLMLQINIAILQITKCATNTNATNAGRSLLSAHTLHIHKSRKGFILRKK
jgi:hypothetical protein